MEATSHLVVSAVLVAILRLWDAKMQGLRGRRQRLWLPPAALMGYRPLSPLAGNRSRLPCTVTTKLSQTASDAVIPDHSASPGGAYHYIERIWPC